MAVAAYRNQMNRRTFASGSAAFGVAAALIAVHPGAAFKGGKPVQSGNRDAVRHPGYMDATGGIDPYIPEDAPRMLAAHSGTDFLGAFMG